jgi:chloramphenicol O-acetyltransferase
LQRLVLDQRSSVSLNILNVDATSTAESKHADLFQASPFVWWLCIVELQGFRMQIADDRCHNCHMASVPRITILSNITTDIAHLSPFIDDFPSRLPFRGDFPSGSTMFDTGG